MHYVLGNLKMEMKSSATFDILIFLKILFSETLFLYSYRKNEGYIFFLWASDAVSEISTVVHRY